MLKEGVSELMFTSDNLWEMEQKKYELPGGTCIYFAKHVRLPAKCVLL